MHSRQHCRTCNPYEHSNCIKNLDKSCKSNHSTEEKGFIFNSDVRKRLILEHHFKKIHYFTSVAEIHLPWIAHVRAIKEAIGTNLLT